MSTSFVKNFAGRAVGVILRVPGLFIAEAWYRTDPLTIQHQYTSISNSKANVDSQHEAIFYIMHNTALLLSLMMIILPLQKLVRLYLYMLSGVLMLTAHFVSAYFVESERAAEQEVSVFEDEQSMRRLGVFLVAQGILSAIIAYLVNVDRTKKLFLLLLHTAPMLARVSSISGAVLQRVHSCATLAAVLVVIYFLFNNIPVMMAGVFLGPRHAPMAHYDSKCPTENAGCGPIGALANWQSYAGLDSAVLH